MDRSFLSTATLVVAATFLFSSADNALSQVQIPAKQKCLTKVISRGAKVAKFQGKEIKSCLKDASEGLLDAISGPACWERDERGKVAAAQAKTEQTASDLCLFSPADFGLTNANTINESAVTNENGVAMDLFGLDISATIANEDLDGDTADCQLRTQRSVERSISTKLKTFQKCQKLGLKFGSISDVSGIVACLNGAMGTVDAKVGKIAAKLNATLTKRCGGSDLPTAFPANCSLSADIAELSACVAAVIDCRVCSMVEDMEGFDVDCDVLDDATANGSCIDPAPEGGLCANGPDESVIMTEDVQAETTTCALDCLFFPDKAQCTADCLVAAIGLSPDCAGCYGASTLCGIENCASECSLDPASAPCLACVDEFCIPAFDFCAYALGTTTTTLSTSTTTTTTLTSTTTTTTLPPTGGCDNPADESVSMTFDILSEATTCTVGCLAAPDFTACVASCLVGTTGLSPGCSQCYAASAQCGLQNCAAECAVDQSSPPCLTCLDDNCIPAFDTCSGLGDPPPPASCTDSILSGDETDVDCGGSCDPCALGGSCATGADCESGECVGSVCSAPSTPIAFDSCINGYIDPFSDADGINLAGAAPTGRDDGYVLTIGSAVDAVIELTNQQGSTTVLEAALVATPGNAATVVSGLATGPVVSGQNGTGGPASLSAGSYYLYVDSAASDTFGPYQVCVVPAPQIVLDGCVSGSIGNGDGNDVAIAGATGAGGDKGIVFVAPSTTQVLVQLRNLSGTSTMAAALYNGASQVGGSETEDALTFTERTTSPVSVAAGTQYTLQVDTSEFDTFGNFEVCVVEAGCGDGLVLGSEQCDDGNQSGGDGCSSSCSLESGQLVTDSCRTDNITVFGGCDNFSLPIHSTEEVFLHLENPIGGSLLVSAALQLGGSTLAATGNVAVGQTGSTGLTLVNSGSTYNVEVCDATGLGGGTYEICVRSARKVELGACFSSNVADGDGNVIDLAGPISGGDEDVIFQPPVSTNVKLTLFNESGGGLLASGIYDGQPGSLLPGSAAGASPSPVPVGGSAESGLVPVTGGQIYRVYTDIASLGTAGTNYTICLAEVLGDNCLNPEDETVRASVNLGAEAESLGLSCTGNGSCISSGMQSNTGLSPTCADCYGGTGSCAAANCALACIGGSGSSGCLSCVESNCAQEFEICSGWVYGG